MGDKYITERLNTQIEYYDTKSIGSQKLYRLLTMMNIGITALIPVLALASDDFSAVKYLVGLAGAVASILSSILLIYRHKENWVEARATCESLISERELYRFVSGPYKGLSDIDRDTLLVERCEEIMGTEHSTWVVRMKKETPQK